MHERRHRHIILILAREFASNLATPTLIADERGTLVYYNDAAAAVVGRSFAEVGEIALEDWTSRFTPRNSAGQVLPLEQRAAGVAFGEQRPAHQQFWITGADGVDREVAVTAFPLFAQMDEFVGIVAVWWRADAAPS